MRTVSIFCLLVSFSMAVFSQKENQWSKSNVKTIKDGKEFYVHKVEKGQTLYYLAKMYKVSVDDLEKVNPVAGNGLQINMEILIPTGREVKKEANPNGSPQQFTEYTVRKQETLYGISKTLGLTVDELIQYNPEIKEGLKTGMVLKVPLKKTDLDLKNKTQALTPIKNDTVLKPSVKKEEVKIDTTIKEKKETTEWKEVKKERYNVALLVPLYLYEADTIDPTNPYGWKDLSKCKSMTFIQFYEGFMMAVDSLVGNGLNMNLRVYDVAEDTSNLKNILAKPEMKQMDLIIGPVYGNCFKVAANFARKNQIPIVNPFSSRASIIRNNPYVFKLTPSGEQEFQHLSAYLTDSFPKVNVVIVQNSATETVNEKSFREIFMKQAAAVNNTAVMIKTGTCKSFEIDCIRKKLRDESRNVIIAFFEGEAPVSNFVRNLNEIEGYDITVFGLPSWNRYENIEIEYLQKLNLHLYEPNFIDYCEPAVRGFISKFRAEYKTEPQLYAFCGFDIAAFFLSALKDKGSRFYDNVSALDFIGLETRFRFTQSNTANGFENNYVNIYKYKDYRLNDVRKKTCLSE